MARHSQLVCRHLENVSRQALAKYQHIIRQYVRNCPGVYALYRRGKLYYVGLASNLPTRLGHHLKDRHSQSWDRFSVYLTIGDTHPRELESLVLRIVNTKGNKQKGKFIKSEDLRRRFARDAKRSWQLEIQDMLGLTARTGPRANRSIRRPRPGPRRLHRRPNQTPCQIQRRDAPRPCPRLRPRPLQRQAVHLPLAGRRRGLQASHLQRLDLLAIRTRPRRLGPSQRTPKMTLHAQTPAGSPITRAARSDVL